MCDLSFRKKKPVLDSAQGVSENASTSQILACPRFCSSLAQRVPGAVAVAGFSIDMTFHETKVPGVFEIRLDPLPDDRGFFARSWCQREFESHGLNPRLVQCNVSFNAHKGTLRGIHYQAAPFAEAKIVRCTSGAIYDVVIDLRPQSPAFKQWLGAVLTAMNRNMLYIPEGCAHGFLTLGDSSEVFYQMSEFYSPESARGVRWDDPAFQIDWPLKPQVISDRDRSFPDFKPELHLQGT